MDKIFKHNVDLLDGKGAISGRSTYTVTELDVIERNDTCFVVRDEKFTTIDLFGKDEDVIRVRPILGKPSTSVWCADRCWGSGVWYTIYSAERLSPLTVKSHIKRAVEKKVGFFLSDLDLKFIKDAK